MSSNYLPPTDDQRVAPFAPLVWVSCAITVCLALSSVWLAQLYFTQKSESIALREEAALAHLEIPNMPKPA